MADEKVFDERAFISEVESAGPEELAKLLMRPTVHQERALRAHLGDERYQRMHSMALKRSMTRSIMRGIDAQPKGNVVVIHGIMGAELSVSSGGGGDLTWVNAFRIIRGWIDRLRLNDDGRSEFNPKFRVSATGIMKRYYGELLLALSEKWNVRAFWFDWRKDLNVAADDLNSKINEWFGSDTPVHIVAHSMGGLVARTFIKRYRERWDVMPKKDGSMKTGGRLVMLGTPNYGSFAIPQVITGIEGLVKKIAILDLRHNTSELLSTFNSFVGSYQMLPSPFAMPEMERLYTSTTYGSFNVPQTHLTNAKNHHDFLRDVIDTKRMIYVAGYDQPTFSGIRNWQRLNSVDSYEVTKDGDGRVPHSLGLLADKNGEPVPTYYIKTDHGNLSADQKILGALDELLESGKTDDLFDDLATARSRTRAVQDAAQEDPEAIKRQLDKKQQEDEVRLRTSLGRMGTSRGVSQQSSSDLDTEERNALQETPTNGHLSPEERKVEETVTRGFLAYRGEEEVEEDSFFEADPSIEAAEIEIALVYGGIQSVNYETIRSARRRDEAGREIGNLPVDAVSVGHYVGVQPAAAELSLDQAISAALLDPPPADPSKIDKPDLILTQYTERGIIQGKLGQPFILPDPREDRGKNRTDRIIAIAGMGEPGRFGAPELTVLVRELCWCLGRLKKRHLATVLIGTGAGNLSMPEALSAWMSGIRRSLTGSMYDIGRRLQRITFVEFDPRRVPELNDLISQEVERQQKNGLTINYKPLGGETLEEVKRDGYEKARKELDKKWRSTDAREAAERRQPVPPSRVTLGLDAERKTYRFGAITDVASIPEREITLDPAVVMQANDELAGEQNTVMQLERGRFLEELLIPDDLRRELYNRAPLVMMLDSTTARIHWEMVAQPELSPTPGGMSPRNGAGFDENNFLGTSRGFTRQLRTTFAPPPEPPPPPRRVLRVLVVADPAEDAHLPGAQEEGVAVADLFESYNTVYKDSPGTRVEVVRLFGPLEATRTNVLRELLVRPYDVLHFAGHCVYRWGGDPTLSGWIFNAKRKELLSTNELRRIDRIPKFVFSNACESGITPDRSQDRNADLAPSFAEAFFERGVANFVCTAWPVDDVAARQFALTLYSGLLGIRQGDLARPPAKEREGAKLMHNAMRDARITIAGTSNGRTTWGAYQHYGNPNFQLFYTSAQERRHEAVMDAAEAASKGGASKTGTARKRAPRGGAAKKKRASKKG